jgi:MYXO-CTERM domain-containing protein
VGSLLALTLGISGFAPTPAAAVSSYYSASCAGCHGASPTTCNGCHHHRGAPSGSLGKTTYTPGESIPVTVDAGQRSGWWRAAVLDATDRVVGAASAAASGPATVTVTAPSAAGTYSWKVAWYGNAYTETPAAATWVADAGNEGHGYLTVPLPPFTVASAPAPEPVAALTPAALDLGTVTTGQAATRSATVSNTGTAALVVAAPVPCSGANPASLTVSPTASFTVASGASATVTVSFAPTAAGAAAACWSFATNDAAHPALRLDATGTGASQPPPPPSCTTCHAVPPSTGQHVAHATEGCGACHGAGYSATTVVDATHDNGRVDVAAAAGWTASSASCSNTCHATRSWGSTPPPPPPPSCTTCHAIPPATGKHTAHASESCGACHGAGYSATTIVAATHQDGKATLGAGAGWNATAKSCSNACHGGRSWGGTSPGPTQRCSSCHAMPPTSGRHAKHRSEHVSCAACHGSGYSTTAVNATTHNDGRVSLTSSVRWNATQRSCANSCHGTERWGGTAPSPTQGCTSCHGVPPANGMHAKHQSKRVGCGTCHGSGYSGSTVVAATHRDGKVNLSSRIGWKSSRRTCSNSCHHTESWVKARGGGDDHEEDDFVIATEAPRSEDLAGGGCSSAGGSLSLLGLVGLGLAGARRRRRG